MLLLNSWLTRLGIKPEFTALETDPLCSEPPDLLINSQVFEEVEDEFIFLKDINYLMLTHLLCSILRPSANVVNELTALTMAMLPFDLCSTPISILLLFCGYFFVSLLVSLYLTSFC